VERVVLNALANIPKAFEADICACIAFAIVFGEADPPAVLWRLRDLPFAADTAASTVGDL
jgi:hypothetical protein